MKQILTLIFIFVIYTVSGVLQAQYLDPEIKSLLVSKDRKELEEAERLKIYGDELMQEAKAIEHKNNIQFVYKSDYDERKIRKLNSAQIKALKSATRKKIRASNQYANANVIIIAVLNKNIDKYTENLSDNELDLILDLSERSKDLLKKSRGLRGKSMSINNELLVYPHLLEADSLENLAINKLKDAYAIILKPELIKHNNKKYENRVTNINSKAKVYYRIQIAASSTDLSISELKKIYPDLSTISSDYENGWYKYSIRKNFLTYSEASAYKAMLNIKGAFITAYVNGKKVPVREALKQEKN